jgi:hypothetical protein
LVPIAELADVPPPPVVPPPLVVAPPVAVTAPPEAVGLTVGELPVIALLSGGRGSG